MFAFFSIGIGLDLNELLHVQAQTPQEQRICGCYCFCEKRNKGPQDGTDVNCKLYVKNVYMAILSTPHRCCIQLVSGSSLVQVSPISDLAALTKYSMSLYEIDIDIV